MIMLWDFFSPFAQPGSWAEVRNLAALAESTRLATEVPHSYAGDLGAAAGSPKHLKKVSQSPGPAAGLGQGKGPRLGSPFVLPMDAAAAPGPPASYCSMYSGKQSKG